MKPLAERLPEKITRAELEKMIIEKAVNDGAFWNKLVTQPREALAEFFGKQPPQDLEIEVLTENAQSFYLITPYPKYTRTGMVRGLIMPRIVFTRRLNYLLLTDPEFKNEFEKNYRSAIARVFNFRFPQEVELHWVQETTDTRVHIVLPYEPHNAMFNAPYAVEFNGTSSHVSIAASASLTTTSEITVEAWIKAEPSFHSQNHIVSKISANFLTWVLMVDQMVPVFMITVDGKQRYARPEKFSLKPGAWYYVAGTYDARELKLYVDGVEVFTTPVTGEMADSEGGLYLGGPPGVGEFFFKGLIDDVRVRGESLPAECIRINRPRKRDIDPSLMKTLRAYYPMGEGNGTIVRDHSGNGNDGNMIDAHWVITGIDSP
jgi:Concanavalin A-like lectin/glucanases superfamily